MSPTTRERRAAAVVLTIVFAVTGCARGAVTPVLTAKEASDQMQSLVRDTMDVAGGDWTSMSDGPAPDLCTTPRGTNGVSFSWDQTADGVVDPRAVMERVDRAWRDTGLVTKRQSVERGDGKILHRVGSQDAIVDEIMFAATTSGMTIEVDSLCGSGNVNDYYDDIE